MLDALKSMFGIHVHTFGKWDTIKTMSNNHGEVCLIQVRTCEDCGYTQIKKVVV